MPFCPKCKSEYREGFTMCADCKVPLVASLDGKKAPVQSSDVPDESYFMSFEEYSRLADSDVISSDEDVNTVEISDGDEITYEGKKKEPTPEEIEKIKAEMMRQRMAQKKEEEFVPKKDKAGEYLSSGIMLLVMGVLGCVFIALLMLGVFPFKVRGIVSYIIDGIMFLFFGLFIYFGINAIVTYKSLKVESKAENNEIEEFEAWFKTTITKQFIDSDLEITEDEQTNFFKRNAKIKYLISQNYPSVSESLADLYIDKYYGDIFE